MKLLLSFLLLLVPNGSPVFPASPPQNQEEQTDAFIRENNAKRADNPDGVLFTVRLKDERKQFHQGEVIKLELSFAAATPKTFDLDTASYDRSGRLEIDAFILDRRDGVVDPLYDYFNAGWFGFIGGGLRGMPELTKKPELITAELNEWLRFDKPGHYRLYVVSGRVSRHSLRTKLLDHLKPVASNVIEFEILPADKKWSTQKLGEATAALSQPNVDHSVACRILRFLGTTAAASEMIKRFRGDDRNCDFAYDFGLIGSPHRDFVIREMENAISLPEQPISSSFLNTLALLEATRQIGPSPPYPDGDKEQVNQWQSLMQRRRSSYDQLFLNYLRQLMIAIPEKQGQARATSLQTLLFYKSQLSTSDSSQWSTLLASMPDVFRRLPLRDQEHILTYQWKPIASVAMLPVLRGILKDGENAPNSFEQQHLRSIALRRLYQLSPEEGRRLIVDEIRRPTFRIDQNVLRSLPDELMPELDQVLASNLEESLRPNGRGDLEAIAELIERYATAEILPRVKAIYEARGGRLACRIQTALLAYLLRVDPSLGGEHLNKALTARGNGFTRCYAMTLADVAELHMSAEVEEAATAALEDEDVEVLSQAARVLGQYGNADAEKALWRRLEKWHAEMESRSEDLSKIKDAIPSGELSGPIAIEQALQSALARGQAWLSDPEKLKRLRDLCLTEKCRNEADQLIANWSYYVYVAPNPFDDEKDVASVAHYELKSVAALKEKLLQFPKGTLFKWRTQPNHSDDTKTQAVFQQLKSYLEEHGMKLEFEAEP